MSQTNKCPNCDCLFDEELMGETECPDRKHVVITI